MNLGCRHSSLWPASAVQSSAMCLPQGTRPRPQEHVGMSGCLPGTVRGVGRGSACCLRHCTSVGCRVLSQTRGLYSLTAFLVPRRPEPPPTPSLGGPARPAPPRVSCPLTAGPRERLRLLRRARQLSRTGCGVESHLRRGRSEFRYVDK